jgi:LemA protein
MDYTFLIGVVVVIAIVAYWFVSIFNKIKVLGNRIEEAWAQIDVQLQKRFDLVPNLVESVKGYAAHEREIFEGIAAARAGMITGGRA